MWRKVIFWDYIFCLTLRRSLGGHRRAGCWWEEKRQWAKGKGFQAGEKRKCGSSEAGTSITWLRENNKVSVKFWQRFWRILYPHLLCGTKLLEVGVVMSVPSKGNVLRVTFSSFSKCSFTILNIVFIYCFEESRRLWFIFYNIHRCFCVLSGQDHITYTTHFPQSGIWGESPIPLPWMSYITDTMLR